LNSKWPCSFVTVKFTSDESAGFNNITVAVGSDVPVESETSPRIKNFCATATLEIRIKIK
jgi:hypothetical protein